MIRYPKKYDIKLVLDLMRASNCHQIRLDGDRIGTTNRLLTFIKGTACVSCGIEGVFFAKEKHEQNHPRWHLNLYAVRPGGKEIMMTSDHVWPKSKGGSGSLANRQPMCYRCNTKKDSKIPHL
jgi:5-methylcytosine-specific restriction endonuclease McrA